MSSKTSWRRREDTLKTYLQYIFLECLQDVFKTSFKMSSRRLSRCLQDVFARRPAIMSSRRLGRQKNVTLKTSWRLLQDVFSTSSPRQMFAGSIDIFCSSNKRPYQTLRESVQIRSFFWSVFSCIQSEYRKIQTRKNSIIRHFSRSESISLYLSISAH